MSHIIDDDDGASIVTRLLFSTALDLSAKAFAQPIGTEDSWDDLGDGVVEISAQNTLRVIRQLTEEEIKKKVAAYKDQHSDRPSSSSSGSKKGKGKRGSSAAKNNKSEKDKDSEGDGTAATSLLDDVELATAKDEREKELNDILEVEAMTAAMVPDILIEDHISEEIPLVGKDCCIVWNSPTHDMSFCIMFTSECGYAAVWSAVHLLQGKTEIPSLEWDYLQSFRNMEVQEMREINKDKVNLMIGSKKPSSATSNNNKSNSKERDGGEEPSRSTPVVAPGSAGSNNGEDLMTTTAGVKLPGTALNNQNSSNTRHSPSPPSAMPSLNNNKNKKNDDDDDMMGASSIRPAQSEDTVIIDVTESSTIDQLAQSGRERSQQQSSTPSADQSPLAAVSSANAQQTSFGHAFEKIADAFAEAVRHVSSMSFVHRHCVAQSYIDGKCATTTHWGLHNSTVAQVLFSLFHPGLIFYFLDDSEVFANLAKVLSTDNELGFNNKNKSEQERLLKPWTAPSVLPDAQHNVDIARALNRAMRLSLLRHELVVPGTEECVLNFLETLQQQELHSVLSSITENEEFIRDVIAVIGNLDASPARVEGAVRCIADIIQNAVSLLPREMMMPMIARIDEAGIVEAIEKLSERILDLASKEKSATPLIAQSSSKSGGEEHPVLRMMNSICYLFEASCVSLNTRAEEGIVGGLWRKPLMISNSANNKKDAAAAANTTKSTISSNNNNNNDQDISGHNSINATLRLLALWTRITSSHPPSPTPSPPRKNNNNNDSSSTPTNINHTLNGASSTIAAAAAGAAASSSSSSSIFAKSTKKQEKLQVKYTSGLHRGGTFYLYHLCGLHDDEGHTVDRASDSAVVADREKFQLHVAAYVVPLMLQQLGPHKSTLFTAPSTYLLQQRTPILTSSELEFFESMFQWCNGSTLKKLLKSLIAAPSVLPSLLAATNNNNNNARLPSHVLCARVRIIRSIFTAITKTDSLFDDLLLAYGRDNDTPITPANGSGKDVSSSSKNNNNSIASSGKPPKKVGADNSLENSASSHPLGIPSKQQMDENKAFVCSIIYRLTFDFDVMAPVLNASFAASKTHRVPLLVSSVSALLSQIKTASNLMPLRRFLRIRHSKLLPEDCRMYFEMEEEQNLREEMISMGNNVLGGGGFASYGNNNNMMNGNNNNSKDNNLGALEHSVLSVISTAPLDGAVAAFGTGSLLLLGSKGSTTTTSSTNSSGKNQQLSGLLSSNNNNNNNTRQSPLNLSNSPLPVIAGNSSLGMFAVNSSASGREGSHGSASSNDGVSPSRRALVVDAEVPPPRSPENIPIMKRRSPSPEQHTTLKFDIGAVASPGKQKQGDGNTTAASANSEPPMTWSSAHNNLHHHHASTSNSNNNSATFSSAPLGSLRKTSSVNTTSASSSSSSVQENATAMLKPTAPTQPRRNSGSSSSTLGTSPRANSLGSAITNNNNNSNNNNVNAAVDVSQQNNNTNGNGRPGSRGARPRSGGGMRTKSPITGLTGSSLMRN